MANLFFRTNIAPYRVDTYNALHRELGFELHFLYAEDSSQKFDMKAIYDLCHFKVNILDSISIFSNEQRFCTRIWSLLRKEKPEVVIVPEFKILTVQVLLYKFLFARRMKVVSMCDDSYDMITNSNDFTWIHTWARKIVTPMVDNLLLVDNRVSQWYNLHYGKGIWLPIIRDEKREIPQYGKALSLSEEYRKRYGLDGKKVLLYVGRFTEVKNLNRLMAALQQTKEIFTTVLVGSGELEEEIRQIADKTSKEILFPGHFEGDEIRAWYNIADAFVLPSTREAFGAVTNEALIAGCQCIISESAGSSCLIDSTNGSVISPTDIDALAQTIDSTMQKLPIRDRLESREHKMPFSFEEIFDRAMKQLLHP